MTGAAAGTTAGPVSAVRRYPVKSMGGESLSAVEVDGRGLAGDRWYAVVDAEGRLASGKSTRRFRRRDEVFGHRAATRHDGVVVSSGEQAWRVGDPALDQQLSTAMGTAVRVLPEVGTPHQDDGQVSLVGTASLRWCAERWGGEPDARRVRANLVVDTDDPFVEDGWSGRLLTIGTATLRGVSPIPRCRMIDVAQDGVRPDTKWLGPLAAGRDMALGVYLDVVAPGRIAVGDAVTLG
jgi:uncharacterized protein YcbX